MKHLYDSTRMMFLSCLILSKPQVRTGNFRMKREGLPRKMMMTGSLFFLLVVVSYQAQSCLFLSPVFWVPCGMQESTQRSVRGPQNKSSCHPSNLQVVFSTLLNKTENKWWSEILYMSNLGPLRENCLCGSLFLANRMCRIRLQNRFAFERALQNVQTHAAFRHCRPRRPPWGAHNDQRIWKFRRVSETGIFPDLRLANHLGPERQFRVAPVDVLADWQSIGQWPPIRRFPYDDLWRVAVTKRPGPCHWSSQCRNIFGGSIVAWNPFFGNIEGRHCDRRVCGRRISIDLHPLLWPVSQILPCPFLWCEGIRGILDNYFGRSDRVARPKCISALWPRPAIRFGNWGGQFQWEPNIVLELIFRRDMQYHTRWRHTRYSVKNIKISEYPRKLSKDKYEDATANIPSV